MTVPNHEDFNTIVCALGNKNEPMVLPNSMGALFINGINNWNRIHQLKLNWLQENSSESWALAFKKQILPNLIYLRQAHHTQYKGVQRNRK